MTLRDQKPTLRDVATVAGVSVSTVSAFINETKLVSPELTVRIRDAVHQLGYTPNIQARNLRKGRAASVGFFVPDLTNPYFADLAVAVQRTLFASDITLTLCDTGPTGEGEATYAKLVHRARLDGIIVISGSGTVSAAVVELAERFPFVLADENLPALDVPFVGSENRLGARAVALEALRGTRGRVAIVSGPVRMSSASARLAGYREAIAEVGGGEPELVFGDYSFASGYRAACALFPERGVAPFDTVIAANDLMALGVLRRLRETELSVPGDVVVVGFDDIPTAGMLTPSLTTVAQPATRIGEIAAELLMRVIDGENVAAEPLELETQLFARESSRREPAA